MQMTKFEEKAKEFIIEQFCVKDGPVPTFTLEIKSTYKYKKLGFLCINGINTVAFNVSAENLDDLFDKAFKILKAYVPKEPKVVQESVVEPKRMNVVDFKSKGDNNNGIF